MMHRFAWLPLLALTAAPAQADPGAAARIKAALAVPEGSPQPGCAVGILRDGKLTERVNAGFADVEARRPIQSDTQFYAASVSKQFTAVAVMQQVVAGKVRLDADVRTYVPDMPRYPQPVTVQMLLNMTGGVRDSLSLLGLDGYDSLSGADRALGLAAVYRQPDTKFVPGSRYDYTNGGYLLLSEIVERVTGTKFEDYVNQRVLKPLGMTRSFVMLGSRTTDANFAKGYVAKDGKIDDADDYPLFGGSGGLITTIEDLAKWGYDIDTGHKIWTPEITRLMTTPGKFNDGTPALRGGWGTVYASALWVGPHWFHHTGGAGGFKTLFGYNKDKRLGVALLCNNGDYDPLPKADAVIAALNEGLPPVSEPVVPPSALSGRYKAANVVSTYLVDWRADGVTLTAQRPDGAKGKPMTFTGSEGQFRSGPNRLIPDDNGAGFTLEIPRVTLHFDKVQ
ncbi:serine hydrolase domain-containing protein [Sphingomonas sp.]|uniref:serine hydrolase domain-containing protein n=1 Tax=Sphingomonas sp. TaxID=28214 RepID=UPI002BB27487|nr:serine hydrolase domain-containing protein [Sphingomonas sp.]HWK37271.1 serine hydrolase domain-containing protein [Sphingomonas sp.]